MRVLKVWYSGHNGAVCPSVNCPSMVLRRRSLAFAAPVTVEELIGRRAHELYVASIIPELSQIIKKRVIFFLKSVVCFMLMIT